MIWNGAATKTMTKSPYKLAEQRLTTLINSGLQGALKGGFIGIEKESLRVGQDGKIAQTPHPISLGSALTHPYITTDYSEALIEFITPPFANVRNSLQFLHNGFRVRHHRREMRPFFHPDVYSMRKSEPFSVSLDHGPEV